MATPQFDSNTWYSLQNMGNSFYLGCNSISICGADTNDLTNFEFFQVTSTDDNAPYYIRPKSKDVDEQGQPFCINLSTGQPSLALCNNNSAIWGTGFWNGANADEGLFFYNTELSDNRRLFLSDNGTWSLLDYNGDSTTEQDQMRWSTTSRAAINNGSYSTVPAAIPSGTAVVTTTSFNSSLLASTVANSSVTISSPSLSTSTSLVSLTSSTVDSPLTTTVVQTPVVTANMPSGSAQTTTRPTASPTLVSGAGRARPTSTTVYTLALVLASCALPRLILGSF